MKAEASLTPLLPAPKIPISVGEGARAAWLRVRSGRSRFQACNGSDDLEDRPRRILSLNPFVLKRVIRILHKRFPFFWQNVSGKNIWFKRRLAHHGQDSPRFRVHGDEGPGLILVGF